MNEDLLDTEQIAKLLHLSRKHVTDRLTKAPNFPPPAINISRKTRRWRLIDVMTWAKQ